MSRVVGIDLGARRIGVAVSDALRLTAQPHATLARRGGVRDLEAIAAVVAAQGAVAVVKYQRRKFAARYSEADVRLLAYVDQAHGTLSGPATRRILQREFHEYHIEAYQGLAAISSSRAFIPSRPLSHSERSGE